MEALIDIIIKEGYADEYLCNKFKNENESFKDLRKEFINSLSKRIEFRNSVYEDMLKKEEEIIEEINDIVNHDIMRRAYFYTANREKIDEILKPLVEGKIIIFKNYKLLKEIKKNLLNILDEQLYFEKTELNKIKDSIGENMYNDYELYFNTNDFLKLIYKK